MNSKSKKIMYYLVLLFMVSGCAQNTEDTIRLMPEEFSGPAIIVFNQIDGVPKEYENGKRVYRIPKNGILKTQFKPNYGVQNHQFFYVNKDGVRTEIPFVSVNDKSELGKLDHNKTYAYLEEAIGKVERYDPDTKKLLYTIQPARAFFIGNLKEVDKDYRTQMNFTFKHHKQ